MLTIENFKEHVEKQVICKLSNNGDYEARYESKTSHLTFVPIFKNVKALPAFRLGDLYQMYRVRGDINGIIDEMVQIILKPVDDTINKIANNIGHKSKCKGAGLIFLSDAVKRYADEIGGDVKIIPSSINEILLTPANCDINSDEIVSVNNGLSEDEILSDHPYIYIKGLDQIVSCN